MQNMNQNNRAGQAGTTEQAGKTSHAGTTSRAGHANRGRRAVRFAVAALCVILLLFSAWGIGVYAGTQVRAATDGAGASGIVGLDVPLFRKALRPRMIPEDWTLSVIAVGDIMMHSPQTRAGWQQESRSYDFAFMFEKVAPILQTGDLVIGNLETPLAGEDNGGFTGYPMFNAPEALAMNLREAGFTLVSTANNHTLDRRYQGLCTTLDHLDAAGLLHTGSYRTPEEQQGILHMRIKGVRIAAIAATYGTNGLTLPADHTYAVDYIQEDKLLAEIRQARTEGADLVIVMLHWGAEYQPRPALSQTLLAESLLKGGADLILGHHPHVLQRGEAIHLADLHADGEQDDGQDSAYSMAYKASGKDQTRFVMYSLGNFVSNQEGLERLCSMILMLTIGVDGATREPYLKEAGYIPLYTQKRNRQGVSRHTVWLLELALAELEAGGEPFGAEDRAAIPKAWAHVLDSQPSLDLLTLKDTPVWAPIWEEWMGDGQNN